MGNGLKQDVGHFLGMLAEVSSGEISAVQPEGHSVTLNTGLESFDDAGTPGHMQTNQMLDGQEMPGEL